MRSKCFFIVSRYNENIDWVKNYFTDYLIYNKGETIKGDKVIDILNIGGNQGDISRYIFMHYDVLPKLIGFVQGNPFDHCRLDIFEQLIQNNSFTALEYYGFTPANSFEGRDEHGGFLERNNNWYISACENTTGKKCKYSSFDEFMNKYFSNYEHLDWIRFAPGSQYIVEDFRIKYYPKQFWRALMDELYENNMPEAHIIERALWLIFQNKYELRKNYD